MFLKTWCYEWRGEIIFIVQMLSRIKSLQFVFLSCPQILVLLGRKKTWWLLVTAAVFNREAETAYNGYETASKSGSLCRNGNQTTYLSHQTSNTRYWFSFLMAHGCRALSIPVFELLNAFQVKKSLQSSAVVIDNSEILILDCTAHLQKGSALSATSWQRSIRH